MALFHFRIKSDKKPDGSKISAVMHVNYIRREGAFSDFDRTTHIDHFNGNFISSSEINDACNGIDTLLYHTDDFGSIRNSSGGIELSDNSSPTTISIALLLADKIMNHQPLIISGSDLFKKSVINAAISDDLPISFADPLIQNFFLHQKELIKNERNYFISNGGTLVTHRHNPKPLITTFNRQSIQDVAKIGLRLPTLSQLSLVHSEPQGTDLLLPSDESCKLEQLAKKLYHNVRWNFSLELKKLAERTADKILESINENLTLLSAQSHVEYINRENAFAKRGGYIFQAHHLPKWANDDPKKFFRAADKYEGCGNRRYVEIEFALHNELTTVEQYRQNRAFPNALLMMSKKSGNAVPKIFSSIPPERKKTAHNLLSMKSLIAVRLNPVNGVTILLLLNFAPTLRKSRMTYWLKMGLQFALTTDL